MPEDEPSELHFMISFGRLSPAGEIASSRTIAGRWFCLLTFGRTTLPSPRQ